MTRHVAHRWTNNKWTCGAYVVKDVNQAGGATSHPLIGQAGQQNQNLVEAPRVQHRDLRFQNSTTNEQTSRPHVIRRPKQITFIMFVPTNIAKWEWLRVEPTTIAPLTQQQTNAPWESYLRKAWHDYVLT